MKKILLILLFTTFLLTLLAPLTGILLHKMFSALFLMLCLIHTAVYRKKMTLRRLLALSAVLITFLLGLFGMIFEEHPLLLPLHTVSSIVTVFFLAIHIFVFHARLCRARAD